MSSLVDGTSGGRSGSFPFPFPTGSERDHHMAGMNFMGAQNPPHVPAPQFMPGGENNNRAWPIPSDAFPASMGSNWQGIDVSNLPRSSMFVSSPERSGQVSPSSSSRTDSLYYTGSGVSGNGDRSFSNSNERAAHAQTSPSAQAQVPAQRPFLPTGYENGGNTFARSESYTNHVSPGPPTSTSGDQSMSAEGSSSQHDASASSSDLPPVAPEQLINEVIRDTPLRKEEGFLGF